MHGSSHPWIALLFALGVTAHNLEEAVFLPAWARDHLRLWFEPNSMIYWMLGSLVSVIVWLAALGVMIWPGDPNFRFALAGFALAMAVNAVFPHLALSIATRSYMPGVGTGLLLTLPLGGLVIGDLVSSGTLSLSALWPQPLAYAVALGIGAFGGLSLAHALVARFGRRRRGHGP